MAKKKNGRNPRNALESTDRKLIGDAFDDAIRFARKNSSHPNGIAGPTGGTKEKPVGLVYVGICVMGETEVKELHLNGTREEVRECTCKITFENIANRIENITKVQ